MAVVRTDALREYQRLYKQRPEIREKQRVYAKAYRERPESKARQRAHTQRWHLEQVGLSIEAYEALHAAQGGLCAICNLPETAKDTGRVIRLAVDHEHNTGRVRGLLCGKCNRAVGLLRDDPGLIRKAATYIEKGRE